MVPLTRSVRDAALEQPAAVVISTRITVPSVNVSEGEAVPASNVLVVTPDVCGMLLIKN